MSENARVLEQLKIRRKDLDIHKYSSPMETYISIVFVCFLSFSGKRFHSFIFS